MQKDITLYQKKAGNRIKQEGLIYNLMWIGLVIALFGGVIENVYILLLGLLMTGPSIGWVVYYFERDNMFEKNEKPSLWFGICMIITLIVGFILVVDGILYGQSGIEAYIFMLVIIITLIPISLAPIVLTIKYQGINHDNMKKEEQEVTREDVLNHIFIGEPTNPLTLEWKPIVGFMKNTLRLRMNITPENASPEITEACRVFNYPKEHVPEMIGLLSILEKSCKKYNIEYHIIDGKSELQTGAVGFFEPIKIQLPFNKAKLSLVIAPGEFQWIINNYKKEKKSKELLDKLKDELLLQTKEWLKNGNR